MTDHPTIPLTGYPDLDADEMRAQLEAFYEEVNRRRTVREFSDRPVPRDVIERALEAANTAPSGAKLPRKIRICPLLWTGWCKGWIIFWPSASGGASLRFSASVLPVTLGLDDYAEVVHLMEAVRCLREEAARLVPELRGRKVWAKIWPSPGG